MQVAVFLAVLIDECHVGVDDATHSLDVTRHVEAGEAFTLAVIDHIECKVSPDGLSVGRGHAKLHEDTYEASHSGGFLVVARRIARAVEIEAATQLGDGTRSEFYLATYGQMYPSP